jgi:hypothetical protein
LSEKDFSIRATFSVRAFSCDPAEISAILGLPAEKTWRAEDPRVPGSSLTRGENGWQISSNLPEDQDVEAHLVALMDRLRGIHDRIGHLPADSYNLVSVSILPWKYVPAIYVERKTIVELAGLGVHLDVDVTNFGPEDEAEGWEDVTD